MTIDKIELPCIGDYAQTPRFCNVEITAVLFEDDAQKLGFTEPTHVDDKPYKILGRSLGNNRMDFAVVLKKEA